MQKNLDGFGSIGHGSADPDTYQKSDPQHTFIQWEIFLDAFEEERRWYLAREREGGGEWEIYWRYFGVRTQYS
jgi:hypothetical protein